jgi:hypothetical protein
MGTDVFAIDSDANGTVFVATSSHVVSYSEALKKLGLVDLAKLGLRGVTSLKVDKHHVFLTAYDKSSNDLRLVRFTTSKAETANIIRSNTKFTNGVPYTMALSADHVFVGIGSSPGKVIKFEKTGKLQLVQEVVLKNGENDIRYMELDSSWLASPNAPAHVYVATNTNPGRIVKLTADAGSMRRAGELRLSIGEGKLLSGTAQDRQHIYVSTFTAPATVIKVRKAGMSRVQSTVLAGWKASCTEGDRDFVYVGAEKAGEGSAVIKITKVNMQVVQILMLTKGSTDGSPLLSSMILPIGSEYLFAVTESAPTSLIRFSGEWASSLAIAPYIYFFLSFCFCLPFFLSFILSFFHSFILSFYLSIFLSIFPSFVFPSLSWKLGTLPPHRHARED